MRLTEFETRILRSAAGTAGGLLLHFEGSTPDTSYLLVGGQHIDLEEPEAVPRLIQRGYLAPDMGRALCLTDLGRAAIEESPGDSAGRVHGGLPPRLD